MPFGCQSLSDDELNNSLSSTKMLTLGDQMPLYVKKGGSGAGAGGAGLQLISGCELKRVYVWAVHGTNRISL